MSKLLLLFLILIVRVVFTTVKPSGITFGFPFDEHIVSLEYYVFSIGEKVAFIILSFIVAKESTYYRDSLWVFFSLMCADLVDFFFTFNNDWYWIGEFPVTLNTMGALVFALSILREKLWRQHTL